MIKVNYYFNSQILFSEYIISFDSIHINKNHKLYHDNRLYIVTNCYYDLFEKTVDAILTFAPKFQYRAYIKMKSDKIIKELEML